MQNEFNRKATYIRVGYAATDEGTWNRGSHTGEDKGNLSIYGFHMQYLYEVAQCPELQTCGTEEQHSDCACN